MSNIFQLIKKLETDLRTINRGHALQVNTKLLNQELSDQVFVNPALLPKSIKAPESGSVASAEQLDEYSALVLQAVWNIAASSSGGYAPAIMNQSTISSSFSFLDDSWVPKIVDQRTYEVGKALQNFLVEALKPEILEQIPGKVITTEVRKPAERLLGNLKKILDRRLQIYEIHKDPNEVEQSVAFLKIKQERRKLWEQQEDSLKTKIREVEKIFQTVSPLLNINLSNDPAELEKYLQKLQEQLEKVDRMLKELQQAVQQFAEFNEQWHEENSKLGLPPEIKTSPLIRALAEGAQEEKIVALWRGLYNQHIDSTDIYNERIGNALQSNYQFRQIYFDNAKIAAQLTSSLSDKENGLLHMQIKEVTLLKQYVESMKDAPVVTPVQKPASLVGEPPEMDLHIVPSNLATPNERLSADRESYKSAIGELRMYLQGLEKQKQELESLYPIPEGVELSRFHENFIRARREKLSPLIEEKEVQIKATQELIQNATREVKRLEREITKLNRGQALDKASQRINQSFNESSTLGRDLVRKSFADSKFKMRYEQETAGIIKTYAPQFEDIEKKIGKTEAVIEDITESIDSLHAKKRNRESFLRQARDELKQFKSALEEDKGFYIPSAKIPKDRLLKNLECTNPELIKFFDDLYQREQKGNAWRGFNRSYLSDLVTHYTSYMAESDLEFDLSTTIDYITRKMELIDMELNGKEEAPQSNFIPDETLWTLQVDSQTITDQKRVHEETLQQLKTQKTELQAEKEEKLKPWETEKTTRGQILSKAQLEKHMSEVINRQAVLALTMLKLEFALGDIEDNEKLLDREFQEFAQSENEALIERADAFGEKLKEISSSLTMGKRNETVDGWVSQIGASLPSLQKDWESILARAKTTVPPTEIDPDLPFELQELIKTYTLEEQGLKNVYTRLSTSFDDKRTSWPQLKSLAQIQIKSAELLQKTASLENYTSEERTQLDIEIQSFQSEIESVMREIAGNKNPLVKDKYDATVLLTEELSQVSRSIHDLKDLAQINHIYSGLAERIKLLKPESVLARRQLLKEINALPKELQETVENIHQNKNPVVHKALVEVRKNLDRLNIFKEIHTPSQSTLFGRNVTLSRPVNPFAEKDDMPIPQEEFAQDAQSISQATIEKRVDEVQAKQPSLDEQFAQEDKGYIVKHLNQVIEGYTKLKDTLTLTAKARQAFYQQIIQFEQSELVTLVEDFRSSNDPELEDSMVIEKLAQIKKLADALTPFKEQYDDAATRREIEFDEKRAQVGAKYFGKGAIYDNYLEERRETYWFKDLISSAAALVLGCFGYKTEAQEREEYLQELKADYQQYKNNPNEENLKRLQGKIQEGLDKFSPRSSKNGAEAKSLKAKLQQMQADVYEVANKFAVKEEKLELPSVAETFSNV
ncbi:hypothetical protein [Fluoribacter dumoffii]|uniref:Uncharacterized protein n=1 Tax=Fluoribacter dumoffii TaxID=463 RepID=A0A377G587_9GAMM|nr:hypothetical protein [Fluoribacter dumoffii]KTC91501.1 hypothetical protein Ldum_2569 [Fluoribacter dumoffii NY 23]STO19966.1 Uncharacterised protein [Fluoribacter dumoffii]